MWSIKLGLIGLLIAMLDIGYWDRLKAMSASMFPIKHVRIGGAFKYLDKAKIETLLQPVVQTSFFTVDIQTLQSEVAALPWVDKVEVKRVWADTLDFRIYEHKPVARWQGQSLLNQRGELFTPEQTRGFEHLPSIKGSDGQEHKLFTAMHQIKKGLVDNGLDLVELEVTERQSWQLRLANGISMQLGRQQPMQKLKRFLKVLPVLGYDKLDLIGNVDLRYPNGFSVLWKSDAPIKWQHINLDGQVPG